MCDLMKYFRRGKADGPWSCLLMFRVISQGGWQTDKEKAEMEDHGENKRVRNKIRNDLHLFKVLEFKLELTKGTLQPVLN